MPLCTFRLREDGLGNRFEQIMNLDLGGDGDQGVVLQWPSQSNGRGKYKGFSKWFLVTGNVTVLEDEPSSSEEERIPTSISECHLGVNVSLQAENVKRIQPTFSVSFASTSTSTSNTPSPVGVHIRKSDRIADNVKRFQERSDYTTPLESSQVIELVTSMLLIRRPPEGVFVASDDRPAAQELSCQLEQAGIVVHTPIVHSRYNNSTNRNNTTAAVPPAAFVDFFALALCQEIWMASSFSSFAAMAARVHGDVPLYSYWPPNMTNLDRFQVPDVCPMVRWSVHSDWSAKANDETTRGRPGNGQEAPPSSNSSMLQSQKPMRTSSMMKVPSSVILGSQFLLLIVVALAALGRLLMCGRRPHSTWKGRLRGGLQHSLTRRPKNGK